MIVCRDRLLPCLLLALACLQTGCISYQKIEPVVGSSSGLLEPLAARFVFDIQLRHSHNEEESHSHDEGIEEDQALVIEQAVKRTGVVVASRGPDRELHMRLIIEEDSSALFDVLSTLTLFLIPTWSETRYTVKAALVERGEAIEEVTMSSSTGTLTQLLLLLGLPFNSWGIEEQNLSALAEESCRELWRRSLQSQR